MRNGEDYFQSLVEGAMDIMAILDAQWRVQYVNPAIKRVLGYPPEDVAGRSVLSFVHPDDAPRATLLMQPPATPQEPLPCCELRFRHRDGSWRSLEVSGRCQTDDRGGARVLVGARDVTERRASELRLEETIAELRLRLGSASPHLERQGGRGRAG